MSLLRTSWRRTNDPFHYADEFINLDTQLSYIQNNIRCLEYLRNDQECALFTQVLFMSVVLNNTRTLDDTTKTFTIFVPLARTMLADATLQENIRTAYAFASTPADRGTAAEYIESFVERHIKEGDVALPVGVTELASVPVSDGKIVLVDGVLS